MIPSNIRSRGRERDRSWFRKLSTHPDETVVRTTDQQFFAAFADVHAVYYLLMPHMPANSLASLEVPARQHHVRGGGEQDAGIPSPPQIQDSPLVSVEDSIVLALPIGSPKHYTGVRYAFRVESYAKSYLSNGPWTRTRYTVPSDRSERQKLPRNVLDNG
jgi:hypothetical protein